MASKLIIGRPNSKRKKVEIDIIDETPVPVKRRVSIEKLDQEIGYLDQSIAKFEARKTVVQAERDQVTNFIDGK